MARTKKSVSSRTRSALTPGAAAPAPPPPPAKVKRVTFRKIKFGKNGGAYYLKDGKRVYVKRDGRLVRAWYRHKHQKYDMDVDSNNIILMGKRSMRERARGPNRERDLKNVIIGQGMDPEDNDKAWRPNSRR